MQVIDSDGYRLNVGIILINDQDQLFWARRVGQNAWQFPQGGIHSHESPREAMYRELMEETGLGPHHVEVVGSTRGWLKYQLPRHLIRRGVLPLCIGQKQRWFMLRMLGNDQDVRLNLSRKPEFDGWRWVSYWHPLKEVVSFKRDVYKQALHELAPLVQPPRPTPSGGEIREPL